MEYFADKLNNLWEEMRIAITRKVIAIGVDSKVGFRTIKINGFVIDVDLDGGSLKEIGIGGIFNEDGYQFGYGVLTHEQLADLTDYVNKLEKPINVLGCPLCGCTTTKFIEDSECIKECEKCGAEWEVDSGVITLDPREL